VRDLAMEQPDRARRADIFAHSNRRATAIGRNAPGPGTSGPGGDGS
jgi:hypothetical protein